MAKLFKGLFLWQIFRTNTYIVIRCFLALFLILFSFYFFTDWEGYFELKKNFNMLLYTKIAKYFISIGGIVFITLNLKKISLYKESSRLVPSLANAQSIDSDFIELIEKPNIQTTTQRIRNKYYGENLNV